MIAHTPAPWIVDTEARGGGYRITDTDDYGIGHANQRDPHPRYGKGISWDEAMTNARLIAAAPELLEACQLLIAQHDASGDFTMGGELTNKPFSLARAAIAKASGGAE